MSRRVDKFGKGREAAGSDVNKGSARVRVPNSQTTLEEREDLFLGMDKANPGWSL